MGSTFFSLFRSLWLKLRALFRVFLLWVLSAGPIPTHIAIIMDGNRRFADRVGLDRSAGHSRGYDSLICTLKDCFDLGVRILTLYAFSIDNFQRSPKEVASLMELIQSKLEALVEKEELVKEYGVCVRVLGDLSLLPDGVRMAAERAMSVTRCNSSYILNLCVAYTSTHEITYAIQSILYKLVKEVGDHGRALDNCDVPNDADEKGGIMVGCGLVEKREDEINGSFRLRKRNFQCHCSSIDTLSQEPCGVCEYGTAENHSKFKLLANGNFGGWSSNNNHACDVKSLINGDAGGCFSYSNDVDCMSELQPVNGLKVQAFNLSFAPAAWTNGSMEKHEDLSPQGLGMGYTMSKGRYKHQEILGGPRMVPCEEKVCLKPDNEGYPGMGEHLRKLPQRHSPRDGCLCGQHSSLDDKIFKLVNARVTENHIQQHLYTESCPPPDIVIRTSGETRLSNFLLWQSSFSHLAFCQVLWPAFSFTHLFFIIVDYQSTYFSRLWKLSYCN